MVGSGVELLIKTMRRSVYISLGVVVTLAVIIYFSIEKIDDGYIVDVGPVQFDPAGEVSEMTNKIVRTCGEVSSVGAGSEEWKQLKNKLDESNSNSSPRKILKQESWYLVEADLTNAEPVIELFEHTSNGYIEKVGYGGTAAPFKDAPAIRKYLIDQVPAIPAALIQCYDPVGVPFNFH